ncbi:hypothetical protein OG453_38440 [Streptomyces sp. NBC_01381]|uniref:hypothetical protein n=1 Tax=Streptomyces sp. NBC_01381 TaxID=2903845 RepID=UPI0022539849|nr:hypothetical protein [Streptomyces sp. NBC_01381]MCX4672467.1 hypothetical protein [Streptomyces sp. NBC_01381]
MSDEESMSGRAGPRPSAEHVFAASFACLVGVAMTRYGLQRIVAEDVAKNASNDIVPRLPTLDNAGSHWRQRVDWRTLDFLRAQQRAGQKAAPGGTEALADLPDRGRGPEEEAVRGADLDRIMAAGQRLNPRDQQHLELVKRGLEPAEMAAVLELTAGAERTARHRMLGNSHRRMQFTLRISHSPATERAQQAESAPMCA